MGLQPNRYVFDIECIKKMRAMLSSGEMHYVKPAEFSQLSLMFYTYAEVIANKAGTKDLKTNDVKHVPQITPISRNGAQGDPMRCKSDPKGVQEAFKWHP